MAVKGLHRFTRLIDCIADYIADVWRSNFRKDVDTFADRLDLTSVRVVFVGGTTGQRGQCEYGH